MRFTLLLVLLSLLLTPLNESLAFQMREKGNTILAIFAHPDDEITVAPLLARYARKGAQVYLAIATDGRFGASEHAGIPAGDSLAAVRANEARCSAQKLGIEPPYLLGLWDGFTHKTADLGELLGTLGTLHEQVIKLFEELKPDVVITWGPDGGYGHPDHRIVGDVVTEVFQQGGSEWPQDLLFPGFSTTRLRENLPEFSSPVVQWFTETWRPVSEEYLQVRISYTDADLQSAKEALACHASQFTQDDIDQVIKLIHHLYDGEVMLRSWRGKSGMTNDLF